MIKVSSFPTIDSKQSHLKLGIRMLAINIVPVVLANSNEGKNV